MEIDFKKIVKVGPTFSSYIVLLPLKTSHGLLLLREFTSYLSFGVVGAVCAKARVIRCNLAQF